MPSDTTNDYMRKHASVDTFPSYYSQALHVHEQRGASRRRTGHRTNFESEQHVYSRADMKNLFFSSEFERKPDIRHPIERSFSDFSEKILDQHRSADRCWIDADIQVGVAV